MFVTPMAIKKFAMVLKWSVRNY